MDHTPSNGYLTIPSTGTGRSVLVLHAWWGLNQTIKNICTRLAGNGYVALAPDLYQGHIADTIEGAKKLASSLDDNQADAVITAATTFLSKNTTSAAEGLSVIGFSLGAYFALKLSNDLPEYIHKVVVFYGTGPTDFSRSSAAYLGHFAENDQFEPQSEVNNLKDILQKAGRPAAFYQYGETGHWFFEPDRPDAYHPDASALAWERTLSFLKDQSPG